MPSEQNTSGQHDVSYTPIGERGSEHVILNLELPPYIKKQLDIDVAGLEKFCTLA
jgi:hypothetical protein